MLDPKTVGAGKAHPAPQDAYDAAHGKYVEGQVPDAEKFSEQSVPHQPDPSPFKLGPMAPGGRE